MARIRVLAVTLAAITLLASAGCGGKQIPAATPADRLTYVTAFGAAGRDAFAWIAQEKGYFRDAGLDVSIKLGAATGENLKLLAGGQAQFATLDLIGALIQAGKGGYRDFRAFAAIHQQTLVSVLSLAGSGITTPKDLRGRKLAGATGSVNQMLFPAYARLAGVDAGTVTWVDAAPQQLGGLLAAGRVDALGTFLIGRPTIEKAAGGRSVVTLPYRDYLPDLYGNAVITTAALARDKPELVTRFRDAVLRALRYTIEHPDEAGALLHRAQPATDAGAATAEIKLMTPYVTSTNPGTPVGGLDEARLSRVIALLVRAGVIPAGLKPSDVVDFALAPKP
jgi:NitT/TauT family transport system substrate-binding protein